MPAPDDQQLLIFELDDQRFALRAAAVREIVQAVTVRALPRAPAIVEGVIDVRGRLVPLLDVRGRLRVRPRALAVTDCFIIAAAGARTVAVRADRLPALSTVATAQIAALGEVVPRAELVAGVAMLPDGIVFIHDLVEFLSRAEEEELAQALAQPS